MWVPIKVPGRWNGDGEDFRCVVCMVKEVRQLRKEKGELKKSGMYEACGRRKERSRSI